MAKCFGSPFGKIYGKVGDAVGANWRGINTLRIKNIPTQRGTLELYNKLQEGTIDPSRFSYPQFNYRHVILNTIGTIGRQHMPDLIVPLWNTLLLERRWRMQGINALVKINSKRLYESMPDKTAKYNPVSNAPDYTVFRVSEGDLEPAKITSCSYNMFTGIVTVEWNPLIYGNGKMEDTPYLTAIKKPYVDEYYNSTITLYAPYTDGAATREAGGMEMTLPPGIGTGDLTIYLYFIDSTSPILDTLLSTSTSNSV
jgi:hypothetical protein